MLAFWFAKVWKVVRAWPVSLRFPAGPDGVGPSLFPFGMPHPL